MSNPVDNLVLPQDESPSFLLRLKSFQGSRIAIVLVVLLVIFSALSPESFFTISNFRSILFNTAILAVMGVGATFVIITGGVDLSVGSVLVFSSVVASQAMRAMGGEGWGAATVGILVSMAAGTLWGILNGYIIAKAKIPALIVTLGTLGMALGFAQILTNGVDIRYVPNVLSDTIGFGQIFGQLPVLVAIAAVLVVIGGIALHKTRFGLYTYAVGSNYQSLKRVGVNVDLHLIKIYALSGLTAGLGGILSLAYFETTTIGGQGQTNLNVIAGVVIGGTSLFGGSGTMFGTVIGLFVPFVLLNGFVILGVQPYWQQVVVGAVLIAAVYFDQTKRTARVSGDGRNFLQRLLGIKSK